MTLGDFVEVQADAMPADYRALLAHQNHMTVTVERYHHSPVDVRMLETNISGEHYARKILLTRQSDGAVVQFGIVRLNFAHVDPEVRREVESQQIPLGRVLIAHNVLREIHLLRLWRIEPGPDLQKLFGSCQQQAHLRPHGDHRLQWRAGHRTAGNRVARRRVTPAMRRQPQRAAASAVVAGHRGKASPHALLPRLAWRQRRLPSGRFPSRAAARGVRATKIGWPLGPFFTFCPVAVAGFYGASSE